MKILFASDLHGSQAACEKVFECFAREKADRLILLGDLLYFGPRNDYPEQYNAKAVIGLLNDFRPVPLCVRGNCDSEVDQMVLHFPIMADYALLPLPGNRMAFLTHGHLFHLDALPPHQLGDVLIHGHTHIPAVETRGDITYLNPGSVAMPKENHPQTYMTYEEGLFQIKKMDGTEWKRYEVKKA